MRKSINMYDIYVVQIHKDKDFISCRVEPTHGYDVTIKHDITWEFITIFSYILNIFFLFSSTGINNVSINEKLRSNHSTELQLTVFGTKDRVRFLLILM